MPGAENAAKDLSVDPWLSVDTTLQFTDPRLDDLLAYWRGKHDGDRLPSRAAIDPLELRSLVGHLFLVDVAGPTSAWRYRLVGTQIAERAGADGTGKSLDVVFGPQYASPIFRAYQYVITHRVPLRMSGSLRWQRRDYLDYDAVVLPLSQDGSAVDQLSGAMIIRSASS